MNCVDLHRHLQPLLDDRLREAEYQALHTHLSGCAGCRDYAARADELSYRLKELADVEPPGDLADEILARLKAPPPARKAGAAAPRGKAHSGPFVVVFVILMIPVLYWGIPRLAEKWRAQQASASVEPVPLHRLHF